MRSILFGAALVAGAMTLAPAALRPALAASPISKAFVDNVQANLDFLSGAARLTAERAKAAKLRAFGASEAADLPRAVAALDAARPTGAETRLAAADSDALMTGRSVAIDAPSGGPVKAANGRNPLGPKDLASLAALSGKAFDDAMWLKQVDALSQLRADYQAYADDGDDPALSRLAEHELPQVEARLAALSRL